MVLCSEVRPCLQEWRWCIPSWSDSSEDQVSEQVCQWVTSLAGYRIKVKCEQILVLSCSQRRKAEEILWKKVFYDVISYCKQHKVRWHGGNTAPVTACSCLLKWTIKHMTRTCWQLAFTRWHAGICDLPSSSFDLQLFDPAHPLHSSCHTHLMAACMFYQHQLQWLPEQYGWDIMSCDPIQLEGIN